MSDDKQALINDWFLGLPEERRAALLEGDRWMLAGAAFEAGRASLSTSKQAGAEQCQLCGGTGGHWEGCKAPNFPTPPAVMPAAPSDAALNQVLSERDSYLKWADKLAQAIADHFGIDIGEHSNVNNPWREAMEAFPTGKRACTCHTDDRPASCQMLYAASECQKNAAALSQTMQPQAGPIDMVLHCPKCGLQHVDAPEELPMPAPGSMFEGSSGWTNPPHRSHLCHGCGHIWRPADVPTNGVQAVKTTGKADSPIAQAEPAAGEQAGAVAWAAVHSGGKRDGKIYNTCDTRDQVDAYIEQVHQSSDSVTLTARPLAFADAAPRAAIAAREQLTDAQIMEIADRTYDGCRVSAIVFGRAIEAAIAAREQETVAREDFDRMSADLTRAKNLLVNLYDQLARDPSPEKLRGMIEKRTGAWFVWGADRDALASPKEAPATPPAAIPAAPSASVTKAIDKLVSAAWSWGESCGVDDIHDMKQTGDSFNEWQRSKTDTAKRELLGLLTQPTTVQQAEPTDEQLSKAAFKGYDDYWTEDCAGKESEAWLACAKAVLDLFQPTHPNFVPSEQEHAAKCPARDGYPCCCSSAPEAMPWNWLRGVINGLPSEPSGYRQLIARHDVLAWIDEGERRALKTAQPPALPGGDGEGES